MIAVFQHLVDSVVISLFATIESVFGKRVSIIAVLVETALLDVRELPNVRLKRFFELEIFIKIYTIFVVVFYSLTWFCKWT